MRRILYLLTIIFSFSFFSFAKAENILDVPFISQFPPGTSWNFTKNCGPTSYLMIDSFYTGKKLSVQSIKDVVDWLYVNYNMPVNNYNGNVTDIDDLENLAIKFSNFYEKDLKNVNSLDEVKKALSNNFPVIIKVYTNMRIKGDYDVVHFMVLTGISNDTVYTNDPGKTNGKNKAYPLQQFLYAWSLQKNAAIIFYPPGHNEKKDVKNSSFLFSDFFDFGKNIFDLQYLISESKDVKGETEVIPQVENNNVVYTANIINKKQTLEVVPNQIIDVVVKAKNTGSSTWQKNFISLNVIGGEIENKKFYDNSWKTHLRPTLVDSDVASGQTGTFSFKIKSPEDVGDYNFKAIIVRQGGVNFTNVGSDIFSLSLNVKEKKVEEVVLPIVNEKNNQNIFETVKQIVDIVKNKVNNIVENIVNNIPTFFSGGSSVNNTNNTNTSSSSTEKIIEPELFFTVDIPSSTIWWTNSSTTIITGTKSVELTNLAINNIASIISTSGTAWSSDIKLVEGENNLLLSFSNSENTKIVTGTLQIVLDSTAPDKPIVNSVLNTDNNNPQLKLTWQSSDAGSGLDYYIVDYKISTSTDSEWQNIFENTTSTQLNFPVAIANTYEFRVKAVDKVGNESVWSNDGEDNPILVDWSKEVVINEIAYAPTYQGNCGGEWIELYNSQNTDLNLAGWSLEISNANSSSTVALSGFVSSTAYKVFGVSNISDTGVKIILKNASGKIIDETNQSAGWFATPSFTHARSMERISVSLSGNSANNWRENNSLRFQLYNSSCGQNYSSQGLDNNSYYYLSNKLSQEYIFSSTSTDSHVLTLTKDHNPYILDEKVILPANYTLILEPGVVVVGLYRESRLEVSGNLQINGTENNPVYFTSARDKIVADWYLSGVPSSFSAGNPASGDWSVIIVKGGGIMQADYSNFWYGGYTYRNGDCFVCYAQQVIRNEGGNVYLNHTNFDNMLIKTDYADNNDAYVWGGNMEVNNSIFNNGYTALMGSTGSHVSLAGNTFSNFTASGRSPLILTGVILDNWENNVFVNNTVNSTVLPALNITADYTLTSAYNNVFFDGIFVTSTATLTILPGVDVNLNSSMWLKVEGNLQAIGTADNHIRICPNGSCAGVWFQNSQNNNLSYTDIGNAGYQSRSEYPYLYLNYFASVWAINSNLNLNNVNILNGKRPSGFGICSVNGVLDIRDSEFGWSGTYNRYNTWIDGGIKLSGGSLYIDNTNFHFLNYGVYSSSASITFDNMSLNNFIDTYFTKPWYPSSIFPF